MSSLRRNLEWAASVYGDLLDASMPGRGDPEERPAPDPTRKPAPGNLTVMEHRHELVRLLRWWVDAVRDPDEVTRIGDDVARMCGWLAAHEGDMADEDHRDLCAAVSSWLVRAAGMMGEPESAPAPLPVEAWDRVVPQSVAAQALGVPVSTIWRRAGGRGGDVRLGDVTGPRCLHDLLPGQCADCTMSA